MGFIKIKTNSLTKNIKYLVFFFIFSLIVTANPLFSAPTLKKENKKKKEQKNSKLVVLPLAFYSPETKIAAGVGGIYTFRAKRIDIMLRPSNVQILAYYTLNKQYWLEAKPNLYLWKNNYQIIGSLNYTKFLDKFWGVGNDTPKEDEEIYTSLISRLKVTVLRKVWFPLSAGLSFEYEHNKIVEVDPGGLIETGIIPGSNGGTTIGLGAAFQWDGRDHIFSPTKGYFCQFSLKLFKPAWGSTFNFNMYTLDIRKYLALFSSHCLAFQGYINAITGKPPLQMLSRLGGQNNMRGYYQGRYRDKNMYIFQVEYRMPVWRRLGAVFFVGMGDVADKLENFSLRTIKTTFGLGIRFKINPEEKMNVRLDIGFSKDSIGVYFNINEAF